MNIGNTPNYSSDGLMGERSTYLSYREATKIPTGDLISLDCLNTLKMSKMFEIYKVNKLNFENEFGPGHTAKIYQLCKQTRA